MGAWFEGRIPVKVAHKTIDRAGAEPSRMTRLYPRRRVKAVAH